MNKNEKELLSEGERLHFKKDENFFEVSAEPVSPELAEKLEKESEDSIKFEEEKKMAKKKEDLSSEKLEEKVLDETAQEHEDSPVEVKSQDLVESEVLEEETEGFEEESEVLEEKTEGFEEESEVLEEESGVLEEESEVLEKESGVLEEEVVQRPPRRSRPPREPDPCPGVSAREHWPMLRNRWFVILAGIFALAVIVVVFFVGINHGAVVFAPKEAISEEMIAARHEMPLRVAYYTGGENSWKVIDRWNFSLSKDSPVVWVYLRGGIPYYDEECRNKIAFSADNLGQLKNANSSLGPVTLLEDGVTWVVDKTKEKVAFLPGLQQDLSSEVEKFTAGGAKQPVFSEVSPRKVENASIGEVVIIPVYPSNPFLFYNDGRGWRTLSIDSWNGDVSKFEFWNFGYQDSKLRYWDSEMKNPVSPSSSDAGNFFWTKDPSGNPIKAWWNGSSVQPVN